MKLPALMVVGLFVAFLACGTIYVYSEQDLVAWNDPLFCILAGGIALMVFSLIYSVVSGRLPPPKDLHGE